MNYLSKLKQLERDENFNNTPSNELPKPPKAPSVSFGSANKGNIEKNICAITDLKPEYRRQKVLTILAEQPDSQRAFITDLESDPDNAILSMAIRNVATFEMIIPREKYDAFLLLELIEKTQIQ